MNEKNIRVLALDVLNIKFLAFNTSNIKNTTIYFFFFFKNSKYFNTHGKRAKVLKHLLHG